MATLSAYQAGKARNCRVQTNRSLAIKGIIPTLTGDLHHETRIYESDLATLGIHVERRTISEDDGGMGFSPLTFID